MAQQLKYGVKLWGLLVVTGIFLFLTGCSGLRMPAEIQTVTKIEKITIPTVARPKPTNLNDVRVYVVNKEILEDFIKEFTEENGELAFVALSMKDYENLALNVAELRRYIEQQKQIIVYYENAVAPKKEDKDGKVQ